MPALSKDTLQAIIKAYKGEDLAGYLHGVMEHVGSIRTKIREIRKDEHTEQTRHNQAMKDIAKSLHDVQQACLHYETTYTPDASGNNDSSTDCDICGKELTHKERQKWIPK